jgi:glycosyltransferase involved in cell wall biosynthesis
MDEKLYYISPRDVRKNRADAVHIMKSCDQFAESGFQVKLVTPRVSRSEYKVPREAVFGLYGLRERFELLELPTRLRDSSGTTNSRIQRCISAAMFYLHELARGRLDSRAIIYSKCYAAVYPALLLRRAGLLRNHIFFEKAEFVSGDRMHRFTAANVDGLLCINRYIHDKVIQDYGIPPERVVRLGFTTQHSEISAMLSGGRMRSRLELGLHIDGPIVTYAGKTSPQLLEVRYILEAAKRVPEYHFVFVGVKDRERPWFENYARENGLRNVTFVGFQPLETFYEYTNSADLLVSYYDSFDPLSVNQRSPAKLGVYLCLGKPIIMADLPSLREWWTDEQVYFVPPDHPELLAEKIRHVFAQPEEAREKGRKCLDFARNNTYETVYRAVAEFIRKRLPLRNRPVRDPMRAPLTRVS